MLTGDYKDCYLCRTPEHLPCVPEPIDWLFIYGYFILVFVKCDGLRTGLINPTN